MSESEALRHVNRLAAFFPHIPVETRAVYASGLTDFADAELADAVAFFASRSERFPSLREIRRYVSDNRGPQPALVPMLPENITDPRARRTIRELSDAYFAKWTPGDVKRQRRRAALYGEKEEG